MRRRSLLPILVPTERNIDRCLAGVQDDIANEDIVDVAQDMLLKNKRRRPVVENGKLIGQITCRQLLSAVKKFRS